LVAKYTFSCSGGATPSHNSLQQFLPYTYFQTIPSTNV